MNKSIGTLITALLILLVAGLAMCATPELVEAPKKDAVTFEPVIIDGHPTGFIAPPIMMVGNAMDSKMGKMPNGLPDAWDWRTMSGVTPVKNQGQCGSCYAFAFVAQAESGQMIFNPLTTFDLSENSVKECNWLEVTNYPGWGSCDGGNALMCANLYSKRGSVLEANDLYVASDVACDGMADAQYVFTDWVLFSTTTVPDTYALKQAVKYQPVYTTLDATCLPLGYDGTYVIDSGTANNNHAVEIVGWDDNMGCSGAWIVKNSWGDSWGDAGYFYIAYGVAGIGKWTSYSTDWHPQDANEMLYFHDEGGWWNSWTWGSQNDAWLLAEYIPHTDLDATHIEFWATEPGTDVDVYLYDNFDGNDVSGLICSESTRTFDAGYHSIELTTPETLAYNDPVYVVAYIDQSSIFAQTYPIPTEGNIGPSNYAGKTFSSYDASPDSWYDFHAEGEDIGLRLRVLAGEAEPPEPPDSFFDVFLDDKDAGWQPIDNDIGVLVNGSSYGDVFTYNVTGKLFEPGCYYLIYYADKPDRFNESQWGGANPGALIATLCAEAPDGAVSKTGSIDLGINIPETPDYNINPDPWDEYCTSPDNYTHCCGAKLWVVPCDDYNTSSNEVTNWNPTEFLFETDLIWYDDTDHNHAPEVLYVDPDVACYVAGDEVEITAIVNDSDGYFDLENMVVEADMSAFGVDDPVVLDFVGATDCTTGEYSGSAIVTTATVDYCNNGQGGEMQGPSCTEFDVTATDSSQGTDTGEGCMDVEPGPCDHLNIEALGRTDLLMWNHICLNFEWYPDTPWFDYELYFTALLVTSEDEYGNMNPDICCDPTVYGTGSVSIIHDEFIIPDIFVGLPGTLVIIYNDKSVETCTITAVCEGVTEITPAEIDIEFLEPIMGADVVAEDEILFHNGDCSCYVDCTTVTAQIVDDSGDPIGLAGVTVQFSAYFDNQQGTPPATIDPEVAYTDEYGVATTEVCITGSSPGTLNIIATAECRGGDTPIDVIEPPCRIEMSADPNELIEPDDCGTQECAEITGQLFDQYDEPVEVEGLAIDLGVNGDHWQTVYTNAGGGIEATICTDELGMSTNEIYAEGVECEYNGNVDIALVEPELTTILLTPDETPQTMVLCSERDFTATCYNQNNSAMCCPEDLGWIIDGENTTWDNGTLIATSVGSDTVWVETTVGTTVESNHIVIDVIQGNVARLEVEMIELELCSSAPITVTCFDCNDDEMDCGGYDVSIVPPENASYSEGEVTGDAVGEAVLNVSVGGVYNTSIVNVTDTVAPVVSEVSIEPSTCCIGKVISICALVDDCGSYPESLIVYAGETLMSHEGDGYYCCEYATQEGTHNVNVTAEDVSGNMGYNDTRSYTAMNLAPVVSKVVLSPMSCQVGDTITVNVTAEDDCTDDEDLIVKADGKNLTYTAGYFVGTFSAVEGTHNVTVTAEDGLGEIGENNSTSYTASAAYTPPRRSGGGSGGGTYPPNWDKPKNDSSGSSGNATLPPVSEPPAEDDGTAPAPSGTDDSVGGVPVGGDGNVTDPEPTPTPDTPGFGAVFAILGLLAIAYIAYRKRR